MAFDPKNLEIYVRGWTKLIPEGAQNRPEDIPKIEEYFQNVCRAEPRFILWKRKSSFPGARGTSRRLKCPSRLGRLKNFRSIDDSIDESKEQSQNADAVLNILRDYLGLSDSSRSQASLLGTKTSRPNDVDSPSSQRPPKPSQNIPKLFSTTYTFGSTGSSTSQQIQTSQDMQEKIAELLERLRSYSKTSTKPIIPPDQITIDILQNKVLLKRIYTELKKQQLHRILGKHPTRSPLNIPHASSLSSLWHFRRDHNKDLKKDSSELSPTAKTPPEEIESPTRRHPGTIPLILVKQPSMKKSVSTLGTQTDFIELQELQKMAKEYDEKKKDEIHQASESSVDVDKSSYNNPSRKSSIDNEDVSQSVSDTIKRYLRMARKKSVADDHANRFKRVNYDRNLRNIHAKGEINPPGMDEDNNKATQTLDAWTVLLLNHIRGVDNPKLLEESHKDWTDSLQRRLKQKQDYEDQLRRQEEQRNINAGSNGSSAPNSPPSSLSISSLFHSAKQQNQPQDPTTMQKSKSSSNVGQFVSKKIWKSRSRSQTRTASPIKSEWTPQGNCVWTTSSGKRLILTDTRLHNLTEIERKVLHRVAIEKINQLNIGINVTPPTEGQSSATDHVPKKRRPLLIKRKALTTSFFDTGKNKSDDKGGGSGGGLVFGVSLEKCVNNDSKAHNKETSSSSGSHRTSRNSITSLLGGGSTKESENTGSCESLHYQLNDSGSVGRNSFGRQTSAIPISRSQSDMRRISQEEDELLSTAPPMVESSQNSGNQVPALVTACINHLEEHGLHTVGIFRVSTSKKRVRQVKFKYFQKINFLDF